VVVDEAGRKGEVLARNLTVANDATVICEAELEFGFPGNTSRYSAFFRAQLVDSAKVRRLMKSSTPKQRDSQLCR